MGGEPDALRLAAGERLAATVEGEIVDADVDEEGEAVADFIEERVRDGTGGGRCAELVEEASGVADRHATNVGDAAFVEAQAERFDAEPGAVTRGTGSLAAERRERPARGGRRVFGPGAGQRGQDAVEGCAVSPGVRRRRAVQEHPAPR